MDICKAIEGLWMIEDWQNMGVDYSKTLREWEQKFDKAWIAQGFQGKYGERFYTMWKMYLQGAEACFSTRALHLFQIVLSKDGLKDGYNAAR